MSFRFGTLALRRLEDVNDAMKPWLTFSAFLTLLLASCSAAFAAGTNEWKLVWADEFDGQGVADPARPDPKKWTFDLGGNGWGNNELQAYTRRPENVRVENGHLVIEARRESFQGKDGPRRDYTSARLKTLGLASWTYGRIEARIKVPQGQGIWPAFWMMGTNISKVGWPTCGEIDVMEIIGKEPSTLHGTIHGPGHSGAGGISHKTTLPDGKKFADDFHLFAVEWTTEKITWFLDGMAYASVTPDRLPKGAKWVYTGPQFLLLNLAVGGHWPGNPDATTTFPQRLLVDYVRVYQPGEIK